MRHFLHPPDGAGDKKMSCAAGWAPAGAARGMATTFYRGSFVEGKPKKLPTKVGYLFQAARRVENRHAGTGEGISSDGEDPGRSRRLWRL
jgi:hypothetical protein